MALWRIRATVEDKPGYLSVLTASLALRAVNILAVQVHTTEGGAVDDFLVDAPDSMAEPDLAAAVARGRGRDIWVSRANAQVLVDPPTWALALAGRVVRDPGALGEALRQLLDGDRVLWRPAAGRSAYGFDSGVMRLPDPAGGGYEISRAEPAFTPAEYARAQALVDLAGAATREVAHPAVLLLADGTELILRPPTAEDLPALRAMHARCSPESRRRRYLTGTAGPSLAQLSRLLEPDRSTTLVVEVAADRVVAMANLVAEGALAEVALLVEDAWQRRGLGTALLRRLAAQAVRAGHAALVAHTYADNAPMLRALRRLGPHASTDRDGAMLTVTVPLVAPAAASRDQVPG